MFVYIVLNTMIWVVVHFTDGRITPTKYEEKEVYSWAMSKRDMPTWMRKIVSKLSRKDESNNDHKGSIDIADTASTIRNSSHNGSAEDKDVIMLEPNPQHRHLGGNLAYQQ